MAIRTACPTCGRSLWVPPAQSGRPVVCPACRHEWVAEADDPDAEPEPTWRRRPREDAPDAEPDGRTYVEEAPRRDLVPHRGGLILVLGVTSLCLSIVAPVGLLLGLAAWVMGHGDLAQMRRREMEDDGRSLTLGGMVTGIFGVVVSVLVFLACAGVWTAYYGNRPGRMWAPGPVRPAPGPPVPGPANPLDF